MDDGYRAKVLWLEEHPGPDTNILSDERRTELGMPLLMGRRLRERTISAAAARLDLEAYVGTGVVHEVHVADSEEPKLQRVIECIRAS